jgi:hypothetical protein
MSSTQTPAAVLCLPNGHPRLAINACLVAMGIEAQEVLPSKTELATLVHVLQSQPQTVAIVDLGYARHACANIVALKELLRDPAALQRIALTRTDRSVWPVDRVWAEDLGFAGIYPELSATSLQSESSTILDWSANVTGVAPIKQEALKKYFDTNEIKADDSSPRGMILHTTMLTAEAFCTELAKQMITEDRTHNMTTYPSCFLASEAVAWISKKYVVSRDRATQMGLALQGLGMLHHVAHEQEFTNGPFFFRTEITAATQSMKLGSVLNLLTSPTGVLVRDRNYLGTNYESCFVGSQAIDWLHINLKLSRLDAEIILNRLHGFGLIEHVTREHPVLDGDYFYRFVH